MCPGTSPPGQGGGRPFPPLAGRRWRRAPRPGLTGGPNPRPSCGAASGFKLKTLGRDGFSLNRESVDLRYVEQLVDSEQTAALGHCLLYAQQHLLDGKRTLRQVVDLLEQLMEPARAGRPVRGTAAASPPWPGPGGRRCLPVSTAIGG